MNLHPEVLLPPVFRWLDAVIEDYGLYIYLVCVWLSPFLIAWILRGGLRRKRTGMLCSPPQSSRAAVCADDSIAGNRRRFSNSRTGAGTSSTFAESFRLNLATAVSRSLTGGFMQPPRPAGSFVAGRSYF